MGHEVDRHAVPEAAFQDGRLDGAVADRDGHPGHRDPERAGRRLHPAVPGQDDAHVVAEPGEGLRQGAGHVGQAPGLRERCDLGRGVEDPKRGRAHGSTMG